MASEPGREVAGDAVVRCCVDAVGGQIDLEHIVVLELVVFGGGGAGSNLVGDDDDAVVRGADADLILGANHAERLDAADLRFLDCEGLVAFAVEGCAYRSDDNCLTGSNIGRTADNLRRFAAGKTEVDGGDVEMVAVGMLLACQHFADDDTAEAAAYRFDFFNSAGLETD